MPGQKTSPGWGNPPRGKTFRKEKYKMKKNKMMRLASLLLVCVLLTTSVISGTFAKYTTSYTANDTARVAKWGFDQATLSFDLFAATYDDSVDGNGEKSCVNRFVARR
jgi:hypothetical protein